MAVLSASILDLLRAQYFHEKRNQLIYESMASTADFLGLDGTSGFFTKEAEGEGGHAKAVLDFINSRNEKIDSRVIQPPEIPEDFFGLFDMAMEVELATTEKLVNLAKVAFGENDLQTFYWASDLITQQTDEENHYRTILDRIASTASDEPGEMIHHLDVWLGELNG